MIRVKIDADSDLLQQLAYRLPSLFGAGVAPATRRAFNTSARYIQSVWKGWAMGDTITGISNIRRPNGKLAQSIKIEKIGPFDAEIYTESPYARRIHDGQPELDMKTTHPYGKKSRVSKDGFPYLIVPFRWGTPDGAGGARAHFGNVIPKPMYQAIQAFKMSKSYRLKTTHDEENYTGEPVERSEYDWGERLDADGNMNGMVRMANETKRGGSTYFTFRVISAKQLVTSPYSWIRKAIQPVDVVSAIENITGPIVADVIQAGLEADIGL
jgi:hypothetical protein